MTEPLLRAVELTKIVTSGEAPLTILDGVGFAINSGDAVAVVGASGSGKTTLLGLLAGLDQPTRGDVWLDGTALSTLDEDARAALRQRLLGFVFQSFQLLPHLTALENVMLPLELAGAADAASSAKDWLGRVGLAKRTTHYPKQLSGGEQQRVAFARALLHKPAWLFLDEATSNLDDESQKQLYQAVMERLQNTTIVSIAHREELGHFHAKRVELRGKQDGAYEVHELAGLPA